MAHRKNKLGSPGRSIETRLEIQRDSSILLIEENMSGECLNPIGKQGSRVATGRAASVHSSSGLSTPAVIVYTTSSARQPAAAGA